MKFCRDHKGSISIFLLVIMVAMLVFSFSVYDFSKINLASSSARNNTDLIGNAVLADYDEILKDTYGLLANSKNIDELSKNVADYYVATMASSGIDVKANNDAYQFIRNLLTSSEDLSNNNILNLKPDLLMIGESSFDSGIAAQPIAASAISNPTVMKRQIVEYMKYRGPISLATGLLEKLNVLKDMGNQAEATNKKLEYEDALNNVQKSSDETYDYVTSYIHNTDKILAQDCPGGAIMKFGPQDKGTIKETVGSGPAGRIKDAFTGFISDVEKLAPLRYSLNEGDLSSKGEVQIKSELVDLNEFNDLINDIKKMGIWTYLKEIDEENLGAKDYENKTYNLFGSISGIYKGSKKTEFSKDYMEFFEDYLTIRDKFDEYSAGEKKYYEGIRYDADEIYDVLSRVIGRPKIKGYLTETTEEEDGVINTIVKDIYNSAKENLDKYNGYMDAVAGTLFYQYNASDYLGGSDSPLIDLKKKITKVKEASSEWYDSINGSEKYKGVETESAKASMNNTFDIEAESFEDIDVDKMMSELSRQSSIYYQMFNSLVNNYGSIKLDGKDVPLYKATQKTTFGKPTCEFKMQYLTVDSLLDVWDSKNNDSYSNRTKYLESIPSISVDQNWNEFSDNLTKTEGNKEVIELLKQISEKNIIEDKAQRNQKKEESKKAQDALNKQVAEKEEESKKKEEESKKASGNDDMSDVEKVKIFAVYAEENDLNAPELGAVINCELTYNGNSNSGDTSGTRDILSSFTNLMKSIGEGGRDNLFITQYLTDSFSCMTTGIANGKEKANPDKSVTGLLLNADSNAHFRGELEYIIYGKYNESVNKGLAIASISGIRFVLNLIYSFTDLDISGFTTEMATGLTAYFPFAMPIVKTVLHIAISAAETAWDVIELTKGNSVPLYKSPDTWVCRCSNIAGNIASMVVDEIGSAVVSRLEKGAESLIDGTEEEIKKWETELVTQKKQELVAQLKADIIVPMQEFVSDAVLKCKAGTQELVSDATTKVDMIFSHLQSTANADKDSILGQAAGALLGMIDKSSITNKLVDLVNTNADSKLDKFDESFKSKTDDIVKKIESAIDKFDAKIKELVSEAADEAKELAKKGINATGEKIMSAVNNKISEKLSGTRNVNFNTGGSNNSSKKFNPVTNLITMTYKDYLSVFLYIQMIGGSETILTRAGQLMQCNINHIKDSKDSDSYDMNMAVTMFNIQSSSKIKTSVIGRFADSKGMTLKNFSDGYYNIRVSSFAGY